jgi:hypothetical protein
MNRKIHKPVIAVIGGRSINTGKAAEMLAEEVGRELARRDIAVICGGGDGIMAAVCKGVKAENGTTFGVMKGNTTEAANEYIDFPIVTSMDLARNHIIVWTGMGVIAFDGMFGTLEETALALDIDKPLMVMGDQSLIDLSSISSKNFLHVPGYEPTNISTALDKLLEIIHNHPLN